MTEIRLKRGTTVPLAGNLVTGELAVKTDTGAVYTKKDDGTVVQVGGGGAWGSITGTLSSQTDLNTALSGKAPLASPTFTGTVTIPSGASISGFALLASPTFTGTPTLPTGTIATTQTAGNSTTALATTAFVTTADNLKANLASPTFTGDPQAPTPSTGDNDTSIATTAFVKAQNYLTSSSLTGYALLAGTSAFSVTSNTIRSLNSTDDFVQLNQTSLQFGNLGSGVSGLSVSGTGITFADSTVQTTATVAGPAGTNGTNGTNGINGANNYLDILTMTSSSASLYVSGGSWSAGYGFMNTSSGWFYNKLNASGVTFKFYINGTFDSSVNAAYNYYSASTSYVTTPVSGDIMTVFISDGTAESTIPLITATY
jgi:hypothetical protein